MKDVRVIAATGAIIRGPSSVRLTKQQHARREAVLGLEYPKGGVFKLDGNQSVHLKLGEEVGIDEPGRLNRALFELVNPEDEEDGKKGRKARAKSSEKPDAGDPDLLTKTPDGGEGSDGPDAGTAPELAGAGAEKGEDK